MIRVGRQLNWFNLTKRFFCSKFHNDQLLKGKTTFDKLLQKRYEPKETILFSQTLKSCNFALRSSDIVHPIDYLQSVKDEDSSLIEYALLFDTAFESQPEHFLNFAEGVFEKLDSKSSLSTLELLYFIQSFAMSNYSIFVVYFFLQSLPIFIKYTN